VWIKIYFTQNLEKEPAVPQSVKQFKLPPKKFQPKGATIIYEDSFIIVVNKRSGLLTVGNEKNREKTAQLSVDNYVKKGNAKSRNRVFIVHRLDRDTSGVVIFAKSLEMKKKLQENWKEYTKKYVAVVEGSLKEKSGMLTSYLTENSVHKVYATKDKRKGKLAETEYTVVQEGNGFSLVDITLHTGRKNQIRVQFADIYRPVYGDKKYGKDAKGTKRLALHAVAFEFIHPVSEEKMVFEAPVPVEFKQLLK